MGRRGTSGGFISSVPRFVQGIRHGEIFATCPRFARCGNGVCEIVSSIPARSGEIIMRFKLSWTS